MRISPWITRLASLTFATIWLPVSFLALACGHAPRPPVPPPAARPATSWDIQDDTPAFLAFYDRARGETSEQRRARYQLEIVPTFPAYWAYVDAGWTRDAKSSDQQLVRELDAFAALESGFRAASSELRGALELSLAHFRDQFADFDPAVKIRIIHSLSHMDGGTRVLGGQYYLLFGVDMVARYHKSLDPKPFLSHELFHLYMAQKHHADGRAKNPVESTEEEAHERSAPLYQALWDEGLATYMSERLNPGASPAAMLLDVPAGLVAGCQKALAFLLADLRAKLDTKDPGNYGDYFLFRSTDPRRPGRAGYYLGYLVAQKLAARMTVSDLVALEGPTLRTRIVEGIDALAAEALPRQTP